MTTKDRLKMLANQVKSAGLAGESMQAKLAEIVAANDLTGHEIQRIAEMANRDVQLALYKTAHDKRFKFELADPEPLKETARKHATLIATSTEATKTASALSAVPAQPFTAPYREPKKFSLYDAPMDEKLAFEIESTEVRKTIQGLDKVRLETEGLHKQGEAEIIKVAVKAEKDHAAAVQGALDLIMTGVTLPSIYQAVMAAVSGHRAGAEIRKTAHDLMMLIVTGLKKRGVPNHRMGFRHKGDVNKLDKLKPEEIMELCAHSGPDFTSLDLDMELAKKANYTEHKTDNGKPSIPYMIDEAEQHLSNRPSQMKYPVPQQYLDDRNTDNLQNGAPRVFNTDNEFVIAITDLLGDQSRMTRLHSAQEYLGLKLKQIENSMRMLTSAQKTAEAELEKEAAASFLNGKTPAPSPMPTSPLSGPGRSIATPPGVGARVAGGLGSAFTGAKQIGSTLLSQAKANPLTALGIGAGVVGLAPLVMRSADSKAQERMMHASRRPESEEPTHLAAARVELEDNGVNKTAFIGAIARPLAAMAGRAMSSGAGQAIKSVGSKAIGALSSPALSNGLAIASMVPGSSGAQQAAPQQQTQQSAVL